MLENGNKGSTVLEGTINSYLTHSGIVRLRDRGRVFWGPVLLVWQEILRKLPGRSYCA